MIVCPKCNYELVLKDSDYVCNRCSYKAEYKNTVYYFNKEISKNHKDYNSNCLNNLYESERQHFWFKNRKTIILDIFKEYIPVHFKIIEIGAGTGNVACMLVENKYDVSVGEIHDNGLEYAKKYGIKNLYQFDIFSPPFQKHFDVLCFFDVIEHFDDDDRAIINAKKIIKDNGYIVLTVPAHKWLWSKDDVIASHKRRYDLWEIKKLLYRHGFNIIVAKHFFIFILPLLILRRIVNPDNRVGLKQNQKVKTLRINPVINKILDLVTRIETFIFKQMSPRIGGSIILLAQKTS